MLSMSSFAVLPSIRAGRKESCKTSCFPSSPTFQHKGLFLELKFFVLPVVIFFNWLINWLHNRRQKVGGRNLLWTATCSEWCSTRICIRPLTFCVYVNDLDYGISSKISKFADDTKVSRKVSKKEDMDKFQTDLSKLYKWSQEWQMLFNVSHAHGK